MIRPLAIALSATAVPLLACELAGGRAALGIADAQWPVDAGVSTGVLYVGAAVSLGILLHDLGGFRRRRVAFVLGLALGIVGARFL